MMSLHESNNKVYIRKMMRKIFRPLIAATLLVLTAGALSSCEYFGSSAEGNDLARFDADSVKKDITVNLTADSVSPTCTLHMNIIYSKSDSLKETNSRLISSGIITPDYFSIGGGMQDIPLAVDSFVRRYADEYQRDYKSLYEVDRNNFDSYNIAYDVNTSIKQGRKGIVVYMAEATYSSGALHETQTLVARNIDMDKKKVLTLDDVLVGGSEKFVAELIVKELCSQRDVDDIKQLNELSIFKGIDPYPSKNFMLEADGVTFIYNADEIATHDIGRILVKIDYSDINPYLKERI